MASDRELLFCDTFSHDNGEELHADMVKFSLPVVLKEVRIIPKNRSPHISLTSADKLGKTSPAQFKLDVYCNDASNPLAPTFDTVGTLEVNDDRISISAKSANSCDLVVIRGFYSAVTVCLLGSVAPPHSVPLPFIPPQFVPPATILPRPGAGRELEERGLSPERDSDIKENKTWSSQLDSYNTLFEPFSPDHSPEHSFDLYDDDIPTGKRQAVSDAGFEEFSDEEIAFGDDDFDMQDAPGLDFDAYSEDAWVTSSASFNPYQCGIEALDSFPSITATPHEVLIAKKSKSDTTSTKRSANDEGSRLQDMISKQKDIPLSLKWIEGLEELPQQLYPGLAQLTNKSSSEGKDALQRICSWVAMCMEWESVMKLSPPLNIRLLKTGLRLAQAVASHGTKPVSSLLRHRILEHLCDIVCSTSLSFSIPSSIKLLALKVVHSLLDYPTAMERFLGWSGKTIEHVQTPYQRILELVLTQQTVRVQAALQGLLYKASVYELLATLQTSVDQVVEATPPRKPPLEEEEFTEQLLPAPPALPLESASPTLPPSSLPPPPPPPLASSPTLPPSSFSSPPPPPSSSSPPTLPPSSLVPPPPPPIAPSEHIDKLETDGDGPQAMDCDPEAPPIPAEVVKKIVSSLEELKKAVERAADTLLAPEKSLPYMLASKQTSRENSGSVFTGLVRMFQSRRLLECLLVLLTAPNLVEEVAVFSAVRDLILLLLSSQNGLLFLSSSPPVTNAIIRSLTQMDNEVPLDAIQPLTYFTQLGSTQSCTGINAGLLMVYHLQVLQSLDMLRRAPKHTMSDLESNDCITALHTLFSMTLVPVGKCAVAHVLSLDENITSLLPFVEPRNQKEHDNKLYRSSISSRYAAVLILHMLQNTASLYQDFLTSSSRRLLTVSEFFKDNQSSTMASLHSWLHPLSQISPDVSVMIPLLVGIVKEYTPQISWSKPAKGSGPIITSLRLILYRSRPASHNSAKFDPQQREALLALFSASAIDVLTALIQKLADVLVMVGRRVIGLTQANILVLLAVLSLQLLRLMLWQLLEGGRYQLRDTRILTAIFSLHTVMCSAPCSSVFTAATHELQSLMVDCLVSYTKPESHIEDPSEPPGPNNSCWCLLVDQLLTYTLSTPRAFLSGLMLLSELLPLPLPLHSPKDHSSEDESRVVRLRQLWAAHLIPLSSSLSSLLDTLLPSTCVALQQMLRRVCAQLVDLAPSLAFMAAQITVRMVLGEIDAEDEGGREGEAVGGDGTTTGEDKKETSSGLVRILTVCAVLSQQPMYKNALLSLVQAQGGGKKDRFPRFVPLLLFLVQRKETVLPAKLCVMFILQSLCDCYVSLTLSPSNDEPSLQQLANSIPTTDQLEHVLSAVLKLITTSDQPLTTITIGLKVIATASHYQPGLWILAGLLPANMKGFSSLLKRLISAIRQSPSLMEDVLSCASEFLNTIAVLSTAGGDLLPLSLLKCAVCEDGEEDLLGQLLTVLRECCTEEEQLLDGFQASIQSLSDLFHGQLATPTNCQITTPSMELPPTQVLEEQFIARLAILHTDEPSSPEYWLTAPPYDETNMEPETRTVDLLKLSSDSCPGLNLQEEMKKQLLPSPPSSPPKADRKRKIIISGPEAQKKLKEAIQQRLAMGRGRDLFRARKLNTSRPPSMHVDDFMNMPTPGVGRGRGGVGNLSYMIGSPFMTPPAMGGNRWMGGAPPGIQYPRRDVSSLPSNLSSWESRTRHFLASVNKPQTMSSRAMWNHVIQQQQDSYNRARTTSTRMVQMLPSYSSPSSSRLSARPGSSSKRSFF